MSGIHAHVEVLSKSLLWLQFAADLGIAAASFIIPAIIVIAVRRRRENSLHRLAWFLGGWLVASGVALVEELTMRWFEFPEYLLSLTKWLAAVLACLSLWLLWKLLPASSKIPSIEQLRSVISSLEAEIQRRHSAEEELVDSQQSLAIALESSGAAFILVGRDGRVTHMNAMAETLTGWSDANARQHILWEVFVTTERPAAYVLRNPVDALIEQGLHLGEMQHLELSHPSGREVSIEVRIAPLRNADGDLRGMSLVFRDLSCLRRVEAEASRLAAIVESSNDAIIGKTLDGRITSWNRGAEIMFGYSAEEAIGHSIEMLVPEGRYAEERLVMADVAHGVQVLSFDTWRVDKGGRFREVSVSISPIRDSGGRMVGCSSNARDITEQRHAEAALRESEARLRFTMNAARVGQWEIDLRTGVGTHSDLHAQCYGYPRRFPEWSLAKFLEQVHADDREAVERTLWASVSASKTWSFECRVIWPDGSIHWISSHGSSLSEDGVVSRILGITMDITQQKLADESHVKAERLEAENRQIQEASRLKSLFLANMSHELRTPLNAIIGFSDLLQSGAVSADSPKHRDFLGYIGASGRHLLQLINDVLDLSKVESGKFEFFPEAVHLPVLVKEVKDVLHTAIQRRHIVLSCEIDPTLDDLVLDPARLKQMLYNYLSNAIKFTNDGGRVTLRARAEGPTHFRLEVEDDGIGIAPEQIPKLFNEFQQLDGGYSKQHQGTGLGLALTRRLVEALGGSVGVRSIPGIGSVFSIILGRWHGIDTPRGDASQADDEAAARSATATPLPAALSSEELRLLEHNVVSTSSTPMQLGSSLANEMLASMRHLKRHGRRRSKIMVIDDDPASLRLMEATLAQIGMDAVCLSDGRQALRELDYHRPDAIVLDLWMPAFDGFAVLDALQSTPGWENIPVFVWTGMMLSEQEYAKLARSSHAILSKGGGAFEARLSDLRRGRVLS